MQQWIHEIARDTNSLYVQLNEPGDLDTTIFDRMALDEFCLPCVLRNKEKGMLKYSISNLVSLDDFLKQYTFEKEEGYVFLTHLFEQAIACNRNKPVLLDCHYIFLDSYGEQIYFISVPVGITKWMINKDGVREWIEYLYKNIQTTTAFEINGYLVRFLSASEFSLPNCVLGLKNIQRSYYPKRFFSRKLKSFRVSEPIHPLMEISQDDPVITDDKTVVLGIHNEINAFLKSDANQFPLTMEDNVIGRSKQCTIVLQSNEISSQHARITCSQQRYYIQDLKSKNGTYLDGKRIQRKMRLKDGMKICFAKEEYIFCQNNQ